MLLKDRVLLVTGGSGTGKATAIKFHQDGSKVAGGIMVNPHTL